MHWLHTRWPAGRIEKLPEVAEDGTTALPGVRVVGDLTGIALLKFAADTGARVVQSILREPGFAPRGAAPAHAGASVPPGIATPTRIDGDALLDLAVIGGGVSGIAAALEAHRAGLCFAVFESAEPFSTIVNFPKAKPIYTYPTDMTPARPLQLRATVKGDLLAELETQRRDGGIELQGPAGETLARVQRLIVAIGRSGNYRKRGVPGEHLDEIYNRLYDLKDHAGKLDLVVGGGDSAIEAAIALATMGAHVTLSHRGKEFSRPKPENLEMLRMLQQDPTTS